MTVPLRYARGGLALTALALAACQPATTPEADYRALESRMLAADNVGLTFAVTADDVVSAALAGEAAGSARLRLDSDGAPNLRRQTVRFPGGEMHVTETYADVTIAP
jgi:hypothetical protein